MTDQQAAETARRERWEGALGVYAEAGHLDLGQLRDAAIAVADEEEQPEICRLNRINTKLARENASLRATIDRVLQAVEKFGDRGAIIAARAAFDAPSGEQDSHMYLSTGCLHGEHGYCQSNTGLAGAKTPAVCKFCKAPCVCACHRTTDTDEA